MVVPSLFLVVALVSGEVLGIFLPLFKKQITMKKKNKKLIVLYKEWMKTGMITGDGLCLCMPDEYQKFFSLLYQTN